MLRAALWAGSGCEVNQADWKNVLETARRQTTIGLICHAGLQCEVGKSLPEKNKAFLRQQLLSLVRSHQRINAMVARVVTVLRASGIEPVLMKVRVWLLTIPFPNCANAATSICMSARKNTIRLAPWSTRWRVRPKPPKDMARN